VAAAAYVPPDGGAVRATTTIPDSRTLRRRHSLCMCSVSGFCPRELRRLQNAVERTRERCRISGGIDTPPPPLYTDDAARHTSLSARGRSRNDGVKNQKKKQFFFVLFLLQTRKKRIDKSIDLARALAFIMSLNIILCDNTLHTREHPRTTFIY